MSYSQEQLMIIDAMKEQNLYTVEIPDSIPFNVLHEIYSYAKLGQGYEEVIKHLDCVIDYVKLYLGALYVGVDSDDERLLSIFADSKISPLEKENEVDKLKLQAAYNYLYGNKTGNYPDALYYHVWNYLNSGFVDIDDMSQQELQFWWELIPSKDYVCVGTLRNDVSKYLIDNFINVSIPIE